MFLNISVIVCAFFVTFIVGIDDKDGKNQYITKIAKELADEYKRNSNLSHRQIYFFRKILKTIDNIKYNSTKKLDKIKEDVIALYKNKGKSEIIKGISYEDVWKSQIPFYEQLIGHSEKFTELLTSIQDNDEKLEILELDVKIQELSFDMSFMSKSNDELESVFKGTLNAYSFDIIFKWYTMRKHLTVPIRCPKGFEIVHNSCYRMLKNDFDYASAVKECYKLNRAYLPIATDKEENEAIRKRFDTSFLIGITRIRNGNNDLNRFIYPNGSVANFSQSTNDYNGAENCIEVFHTGEFSSVECSRKSPIICQTDPINSKSAKNNNISKCEPGWQYFKYSVNNSVYNEACYSKLSGKMTYNAAVSACAAANPAAKLPKIYNQAQNDALTLQYGYGFILGIIRTAPGSFEFKYSDDGTSPSYYNWDIDNPDNFGGVENCVKIKAATPVWNDYPCNNLHDVVCEINLMDPCAACSGSVAALQNGETSGKCFPTTSLGSYSSNTSAGGECTVYVTCNNPGKIRAFLTERNECVESDNSMEYKCRNGRWQTHTTNYDWQPVDQIYCPDESATTTTTAAPNSCPNSCPAITTTNIDFSEWNGYCFGYDMSKQTLKEPIITDISNETTCAYKYTCPDPTNDAFVTIFTNSKNAPADRNRCYIFPTIPMYGEERIVQCDSSSGKFIMPGGSNGDTIFSAIACITYPNTNNNECD